MSGVIVKFTGKQELTGTTYSFSVQSNLLHLPNLPDVDAPLRPNDAPFVGLAQLLSDPSVDTPHIKDAGLALHGMLTVHPNTNGALTPALHANAASPDRNIRLHFPDYAEEMMNLPWETLYDPANGFLDPDAGLPVLRMVDTRPGATQPPATLTDDTLRIFSVIAAQGIDGLSEYKALMRALASYTQPWTLHIYAPDQTVIDEIANTGPANVTHFPMPGSATALMADIAAFRPQICHFFCHGVSVGQGPARLELATRSSAFGAATVEVKASQLAATLPSSAWLVLLNACNSGQGSSDSGSLATNLVADGVPVVVGMREPTQTRTLNTFTEGFLEQALVSIGALFAQGAPFSLDLGPSVTAGRNAICASFRQPQGNPAERVKDWSLPVMIVSPTAFQIDPSAGAGNVDLLLIARLEGERASLVAFLDRMGQQLAPDKVQAVEQKIAQIDAEIGTALA